MSRVVVITGTEIGVDHFWDNVRRITDDDEIPSGFAGPFTLDEAMQISWRIKLFHCEADIQFRPSDTDPYEDVTGLNMDVPFGQEFEASQPPSIIRTAFQSELEYAAQTQWVTSSRTSFVQALNWPIADTSSPIVQAFCPYFAADTVPLPLGYRFLYRRFEDVAEFYIGVSMSFNTLSIPVFPPDDQWLEQDGVTFTFFGKRVAVFAFEGTDASQYIGTASIEIAEGPAYWEYADALETPTYDTFTGEPLDKIPLTMP